MGFENDIIKLFKEIYQSFDNYECYHDDNDEFNIDDYVNEIVVNPIDIISSKITNVTPISETSLLTSDKGVIVETEDGKYIITIKKFTRW